MKNLVMAFAGASLAVATYAHAQNDACTKGFAETRDRVSEVIDIANDVTYDHEAVWVDPILRKPGVPVVMLVGPSSSRKNNLGKRIAGPIVGSQVIYVAAGTRDSVRLGLNALNMALMMDEPTLFVLNVTLPPTYHAGWIDSAHARAELVKLGFDIEELYKYAGVYLIQE